MLTSLGCISYHLVAIKFFLDFRHSIRILRGYWNTEIFEIFESLYLIFNTKLYYLLLQVETLKQEEATRLREEEERQNQKKEETLQKVSEALDLLSQRHDLLPEKRYRYVSNCIICFFSDFSHGKQQFNVLCGALT